MAYSPLAMPDRGMRMELWSRMDYNGNGILSLAEIDRFLHEIFPEFDNKPSLMQAFKAAELLRIKRDEKLTRDRLQRNVLRREEHERTKAYFAPIFHAGRFLLEPRPSTVDKDWKAMSFS